MTAGSCNCSACWRGLSKHNKGSFWFSEYFDMCRDDDRSSGTPVCIPIWHLCTSQCGVTRWPRGQYYACPQFLGCYPWCYASGSSLSSFDIRGLFVLFSFLSMFAVLDALLQCFGILWRLVASFIVFQLNLSCLELFLFCFVFCVMIDSRINAFKIEVSTCFLEVFSSIAMIYFDFLLMKFETLSFSSLFTMLC